MIRNRLRSHWLQLRHLGPVAYLPPDSGQTPPEGEPAEGRFRWPGRESDAEVGLQYHRARHYDPAVGRWTSQDPLGYESGDGNLYPYARPPEATPPAPDAAGRPPQP